MMAETDSHPEEGVPYTVRLEMFEGPLDLLLHLIKKNELDITNIPIALITDQYLEYLKLMKVLNLDVAGEYLLMASTLLHIKSKICFLRHRRKKRRRVRIREQSWYEGFSNIRNIRRRRSNSKEGPY